MFLQTFQLQLASIRIEIHIHTFSRNIFELYFWTEEWICLSEIVVSCSEHVNNIYVVRIFVLVFQIFGQYPSGKAHGVYLWKIMHIAHCNLWTYTSASLSQIVQVLSFLKWLYCSFISFHMLDCCCMLCNSSCIWLLNQVIHSMQDRS
jgi:hypothetical protein